MAKSGSVAKRRHRHSRIKRATLVCLLCVCTTSQAGVAEAQSPSSSPNTGALTFTGGLEVPSVFFFRGLRQERDPKTTLAPYGDLRIALASGDGLITSLGVNVGIRDVLLTGSSGSEGPSRHTHFEEDFYTTLDVGLSGRVHVATTYRARTSPNFMFDTISELQLNVERTDWLHPHGLVVYELTDQSTDGGTGRGRYAELGVEPTFRLWGGRATLSVPLTVGFSLKDYYEWRGEDHAFGFADLGGVLTIPLRVVPERFGAWSVRGAMDALRLGETARQVNTGKASQVVGLVGIGLSY